MGEVKENMKTTTKDLRKDTREGILGKILPKRKKEEVADTAVTFADMITEADKKLSELIVVKERDLKTEKGQEEHNRLAVAHLRAIQFHMDEICNLASEYPN